MEPWMGALMDNLESAHAEPVRRLLGPRRDDGSLAPPHQDPLVDFMRGRNVLEPLHHHRRGPEPHAQADEGAGNSRGARDQRWCASAISRRSHPYLTETTTGLTYVVTGSTDGPTRGTLPWCAASARVWQTMPPKSSD